MAKVKTLKLLSFTLPNKVGQLAAVTELLGGAGVSITGLRAADAGSNAEFLLAVKNPAKARKVLAPLSVDIKEADALCVEMPNKPGRLQKVAKKLAEAGVNIQSSWATAFTGKTASCVLMTSDDKKAIAALEK
ncbi:MAG: hypothetical protein ABSG21_18575 [Spirochaetia bacterium]|jgi:hypothetical protein